MLIDPHGRRISYLRLSITDRCNLRCLYCRTQESWTCLSHSDILTYEEMFELVRVACASGVEKVRLTGGEPFARRDFLAFLFRLNKAFPNLDLRITTNGTLLDDRIAALGEAGVRCLNISLDTLNADKFKEITGVDAYHVVRKSIDACLNAGLRVKINAVALKGINDDELPAFVDFARTHAVDVRFIEFMPIGYKSQWSSENYWSAKDIIASAERIASLHQVARADKNSGPARMFGIDGGIGRFGVISAVSHHFCDSCNRLRVTSDGKLRTCLFSDKEYDLRTVLRAPEYTQEKILDVFRLAKAEKPMGYKLLQERDRNQVCDRAMTAIGG